MADFATDFANSFSSMIALGLQMPTKEEKAFKAAQTGLVTEQTENLKFENDPTQRALKTKATETAIAGTEAETGLNIQKTETAKYENSPEYRKLFAGHMQAETASLLSSAGVNDAQAKKIMFDLSPPQVALSNDALKAATASNVAAGNLNQAQADRIITELPTIAARAKADTDQVIANTQGQTIANETGQIKLENFRKSSAATNSYIGALQESYGFPAETPTGPTRGIPMLEGAAAAPEGKDISLQTVQPEGGGAIPDTSAPAAASTTPTRSTSSKEFGPPPLPSDPDYVGTISDYTRQAALARGMDPETAVKVFKSEGLKQNTWQSNYRKNGVRETSYGPAQLLVRPGNPGLGDAFMKQTGLDPRDPSTVYQQIDFALDQAKQNGWGAWYGAKRVGIGDMEGINPGKGMNVGQGPTVTRAARGQSISEPAQSLSYDAVNTSKTALKALYLNLGYGTGAVQDQQSTQRMRGILSGSGAASPEAMNSINESVQKSLPKGAKLTLAQRNLLSIIIPYKMTSELGTLNNDTGLLEPDPKKAQDLAGSILQRYRTSANNYAAIAKSLAQNGRLDEAAQVAAKAYAYIPDGKEVSIEKTKGGYNLVVTDIADKSKIYTEKLLTPNELYSGLMKWSPVDFDKALMQAAGERVPSAEYERFSTNLAAGGGQNGGQGAPSDVTSQSNGAPQYGIVPAGKSLAENVYNRAIAGNPEPPAGNIPQRTAIPAPPNYAAMGGDLQGGVAGESSRAAAAYNTQVSQIEKQNKEITPPVWTSEDRKQVIQEISDLTAPDSDLKPAMDILNKTFGIKQGTVGSNTTFNAIESTMRVNPDLTADIIVPEIATIVQAQNFAKNGKPYEVNLKGDYEDTVKLKVPGSTVEMNVPTIVARAITKAADANSASKRAEMGASLQELVRKGGRTVGRKITTEKARQDYEKKFGVRPSLFPQTGGAPGGLGAIPDPYRVK